MKINCNFSEGNKNNTSWLVHANLSNSIFFFNFTQPGRQSCKHLLCHWGRLWKPIQFCATLPIFRAPLYLKLSHKTEETLCLLSQFVVCVRAPGREDASSSAKNCTVCFLSTRTCVYIPVLKRKTSL